MELEVARTMFDYDALPCLQLLLFFLCVALGQQWKTAWNSVAERKSCGQYCLEFHNLPVH